MRDTHFLYGIATFALLAMLAGLIIYATDSLPTHTPQQQAPMETVVPLSTASTTGTKKSCGCCAERRERLQKRIREARERRKAAQQTVNVEAAVNSNKY